MWIRNGRVDCGLNGPWKKSGDKRVASDSIVHNWRRTFFSSCWFLLCIVSSSGSCDMGQAGKGGSTRSPKRGGTEYGGALASPPHTTFSHSACLLSTIEPINAVRFYPDDPLPTTEAEQAPIMPIGHESSLLPNDEVPASSGSVRGLGAMSYEVKKSTTKDRTWLRIDTADHIACSRNTVRSTE